MRIRFRQSGGFAGLVRGCTIQTETLPADERARIERLVECVHSIARGDVTGCKNAADVGQFEITTDLGRGPYTLRFDELSVPQSITALVEFLMSHAEPVPLED